MTSERIVVLHAETGAGKSSLINAGLIPELTVDGFLIGRGLRPQDLTADDCSDLQLSTWIRRSLAPSIRSQYASPGESDSEADARVEGWLSGEVDVVESIRTLAGSPPVALCIDQTEELFRLGAGTVQKVFSWLGQLARSPGIWLILVIRNSHLAELLQHARYFPGELRSRFALPLLSKEDCRYVVRRTLASAQGDPIALDSVEAEVEEFIKAAAEASLKPRPYDASEDGGEQVVLPLFLQAVGHRWFVGKFGDEADDDAVTEPDQADSRRSDPAEGPLVWLVDQEIRRALHRLGPDAAGDEQNLRDWCEANLVDRRSRRPAHIPRERLAVGVRALLEGYLVTRLSSSRVELAHDAFVAALLESNRRYAETCTGFLASRARAWRIHSQSKDSSVALLGPMELLRAVGEYRSASERDQAYFRASLKPYSVLAILIALAVVALGTMYWSVAQKRRADGEHKNLREANLVLRSEANLDKAEMQCLRLKSAIHSRSIASGGLERHFSTLRDLLAANLPSSRPGCNPSVAPSFAEAELLRFANQDFFLSTRPIVPELLGSSKSSDEVLATHVEDFAEGTATCQAGTRLVRQDAQVWGNKVPLRLEIFPQDLERAADPGWSGHRSHQLLTVGYLNGEGPHRRKRDRPLVLDVESEARAREQLFPDNSGARWGRYVTFATSMLREGTLTGATAFRDGRVFVWDLRTESLGDCFGGSGTQCKEVRLIAWAALGNQILSGCFDHRTRDLHLLTDADALVTIRLQNAGNYQATIPGKGSPAESVVQFGDRVILRRNADLGILRLKDLHRAEGSALHPPAFDYLEKTRRSPAADFNVGVLSDLRETALFQIRRNGEVWWRGRDRLDAPIRLRVRDDASPDPLWTPPKECGSARRPGVAAGEPTCYEGDSVFLSDGLRLTKNSMIFVRNVRDTPISVANPDFFMVRVENQTLISKVYPWAVAFSNQRSDAASAGFSVEALARADDETFILGLSSRSGNPHLALCRSGTGSRLECQGPWPLVNAEGEIMSMSMGDSIDGQPSLLAIGFSSGELALVSWDVSKDTKRIEAKHRIIRAVSGISALHWQPPDQPVLGQHVHDVIGSILVGTRSGRILVQNVPRKAAKSVAGAASDQEFAEGPLDDMVLLPAYEVFRSTDSITFLDMVSGYLFAGDRGGNLRVLRPNWREEVLVWACRQLDDLRQLSTDPDVDAHCKERLRS